MTLPITIETAQELEANYGYTLDTNKVSIDYYYAYPNAKWCLSIPKGTIREYPKIFLPTHTITTLVMLPSDAWYDFLKAEYGINFKNL